MNNLKDSIPIDLFQEKFGNIREEISAVNLMEADEQDLYQTLFFMWDEMFSRGIIPATSQRAIGDCQNNAEAYELIRAC